MNGNTQTPAELGYRMPAEWEPHATTWLAWPHNQDDWPGKFAAIPFVYAEIVRHLSRHEHVSILVNDRQTELEAHQAIGCTSADPRNITYHRVRTNRVWLRDSGPIFLLNAHRRLAMTDWQFNAWSKYADWQEDDAVPAQLQEHLKCHTWQPTFNDRRIILEGGSIDVNGNGLLLTTEECLLSDEQQRNPELSRGDLEQVFADFLGVKKVLWLNRGIVGDDTHGHIDDLARFVGPRRVVTVVEENAADENYQPLQENLDRLRGMTDVSGQALEIVNLPMPAPVVWEGQRLPASYANFYVANDLVLVPTFNDPNDRKALGILAELFPRRTIVGIHAVDLIWGLGTIHCMTQQQPEAVIEV